MTTTKIAVSQLKAGDRIMPPAREISLWMRREVTARGLSDEALLMTVVSVEPSHSDKRGEWMLIIAAPIGGWLSAHNWKIHARPSTLWPVEVRS